MSGTLFNRYLAVHFVKAGRFIGGRQELVDGQVVQPPSIEFEITHTSEGNANEATVKLFNLAPETQKALLVEGRVVEIIAGYWPSDGGRYTGVIFKGQIRDAKTRMEGGIEVISELTLGDGDDAISHRQHKKKHKKGTTHQAIVNDIAAEFEKDGIKRGKIVVPAFAEPRPRTVNRRASRELDDICLQHDLQWSVQDGVLNVFPRSEPLRTTDWVLEPETGVLDSPEFNDKGVEIRTLLYPDVRPGLTFTLRNRHVKERAPGQYKIDEVTFSGNNFGGEFGCRIVGITMQGGKAKRSRDRLPGNRT